MSEPGCLNLIFNFWFFFQLISKFTNRENFTEFWLILLVDIKHSLILYTRQTFVIKRCWHIVLVQVMSTINCWILGHFGDQPEMCFCDLPKQSPSASWHPGQFVKSISSSPLCSNEFDLSNISTFFVCSYTHPIPILGFMNIKYLIFIWFCIWIYVGISKYYRTCWCRQIEWVRANTQEDFRFRLSSGKQKTFKKVWESSFRASVIWLVPIEVREL